MTTPMTETTAAGRTIRMIGSQILVRRHIPPSRAGRLHVPTTARRRLTAGRVLAIGPDVRSVSVGDEVVYAKYAGEDVGLDGDVLIVVTEGDVLGILEDAATRAAREAAEAADDEADPPPATVTEFAARPGPWAADTPAPDPTPSATAGPWVGDGDGSWFREFGPNDTAARVSARSDGVIWDAYAPNDVVRGLVATGFIEDPAAIDAAKAAADDALRAAGHATT